jgi:biotin operon repressor
MSSRQAAILHALQDGPATAWSLGLVTGAPHASVRRDIQVLRRLGHNINDARDDGGLYRIVGVQV